MFTLQDRERALEAKFAADQTLDFKAHARRARLLAEWAGAKLGLGLESVQGYVLEVWRVALKRPGDEHLFSKVIGDFDRIGLCVPADDVRRVMAEFLAIAREDVAAG